MHLARYLGNKRSMVVHDTDSLKERCNTDDLKEKLWSNHLEAMLESGYRLCQHCFK